MNKITTLATTSNLPYQPQFGRWIKADERSLRFDPKIPEEVFTDFLKRLLDAQTTLYFWIGDAINFAGAYKRGKYKNWLKKTQYKYSTLANFAYVAGKILPESRRPELSFSFHLLAASMKKKRDWALVKAIKEKLTVKEFTKLVRPYQSHYKGSPHEIGLPINVKGLELHHEPLNELGVVLLFAMLCKRLGFRVEGVRSSFPDCVAQRRVKRKWQRVKIEFEYKSQNFAQHRHNENNCDLIVCWENDWVDCPIEVLCLKDEIEKMA